MIKIEKGKEPPELMAYRKQKFSSYEDMPKNVHDAVVASLMKEQGCICAYCMRKIPQKHKEPAVTIEHIDAQSLTDIDRALDYRNMLAVCNGNRGCGNKKNMTCDAKRQNEKLYVNPLDGRTLHSIEYKRDGTIFSLDDRVNKDLNVTLNLNCPEVGLTESRCSALREIQVALSKRKQDGDIKFQCKKFLEFYRHQEVKTPYVGILIWWLEKKINS